MSRRPKPPPNGLETLLRGLKLPSFAACHESLAKTAEEQGWTFVQYLEQLTRQEMEDRRGRRIERLLRASDLLPGKTLATLKQERLPPKVRRQLSSLCAGDFVGQAMNVLLFGLPGRGKTHLANAIGYELIRRGHSVLFRPTYSVVQMLLTAKKALDLEGTLNRLDRFDVVILDDLGYVQQDREEMEVLFTFLAERYERRSVVITSNLVFSQWERIFKDPLTTAAAIDRIVHHSIILELTGTSARSDEAKARSEPEPGDDN